MTKRPTIHPDNFSDIYDYYGGDEHIRRGANNFFYKLGHAVYAPEVIMADETRETILDQQAQGKGALVVSNHPSWHDVFALAGAFDATKLDVFDMVRPTAKDSMFRGGLRPIMTIGGGLPVFRDKSYPDTDRRTLSQAALRMTATAAQLLRSGQSVSIMPEGTNSAKESLTQLDCQKLKTGVGKIAYRATDEYSYIVPIAISYRTDNPTRLLPPRHPVVVFDTPITEYMSSVGAINQQIFDAMQAALDQASNAAGHTV